MKMAVCRSCGATLIISAERLAVCGRCGEQVAEAQSEIARTRSSRRWMTLKWIGLIGVMVGLAGSAFQFRAKISSWLFLAVDAFRSAQTTSVHATWYAYVGVAALIGWSMWVLRRRRIRVTNSRLTRTQPSEPNGANLKRKIERLATEAWGAREDIVSNKLALRQESISKLVSPSEFVTSVLRHVGKVSPNLSVPMMTPRVVQERLCEAAGQFVEQDGWVKIVVDPHFFDDQAAAHAILCHELCHYILGANGIREGSILENERLTDVAIFVFGLGDIFLAGYRRKPRTQYRSGHRLGYLTDDEYLFVHKYVAWLRSSEEFQRTARRKKDHWNWDRSLR
jgi:hypothetical protein